MTEQSVASLDPRLQKLVESARVAFERGNYDHVIELARDVLGAAPGCLPVRKLQRTALLKRHGSGGGFFAKALGSVSTAPFFVSGNVALGKDPAKALASAQKMLEVDPNSVAGLRLLGGAASALGWHETAVFACEALRENAPDDLANLIALGRAHLGAGRADAAVRCAEAVLARESIHGAAQSLLKDASVAQTMKAGRWGEDGDFRAKVKS